MKRCLERQIATSKKLREDALKKRWEKSLAVMNGRMERENMEFNEKVLHEA
jgi:hypothetical protein